MQLAAARMHVPAESDLSSLGCMLLAIGVITAFGPLC